MTPALAHDLLMIGSRGPAVVSWQQQLNVVRDPDIAVDGLYGPITAGATRDFQVAAGIAVDGVVGPQTRHAMRHALADRPPLPPPGEPTPQSDLTLVRENLPIRRGDRGEPVAAVQRLVSSTRQGNIAVDGIFGPQTERAVRDFQWSQRILVDGIVGPQTATAFERALATAPPTAQPADCSASDQPAEPEAQPELPDPVQETRREIYRAAVSCDYDRLGELVPAEGFTYSFGGGEDPIAFWRDAEQRQDASAPMRYLAGVLQRPHAMREVQGRTQYEWPSAFAYDRWAEVPAQERQALQPLYDEEDFAGFEQFGGYTGYRVIITQDGTWTAFVAGD